MHVCMYLQHLKERRFDRSLPVSLSVAFSATVGESMFMQKDYEAWCEEKARWAVEVERARQMEKESFDRCEVGRSNLA